MTGTGGSGGMAGAAGGSGGGGTSRMAGSSGSGGTAGTGGNGATAGTGGSGGTGGMATPGPIEDLEPGHWLEVKNLDLDGNGSIDIVDSRLDAKDPCPTETCDYSIRFGVQSVMDAFSGAAFDSGRDRLIVWGSALLP